MTSVLRKDWNRRGSKTSDSVPKTRKLGRDEKGVVYVEFLLVFPPIFVLFLVTMQWALLSASDLGVRHAASAAARSAIVVLPDDKQFYEGQEANEIPVAATCSEGFVGKIHKLLGKVGINSGVIPDDGQCPGGARMSTIRFAAIMRMMPFSPNPQSIAPAAFGGVIGQLGVAGWVAGAAAYAYGATAVTFHKEPGSDERVAKWGPNENVTVRVTYMAHCGIPIARYLMCDKGNTMIPQSSGSIGDILNQIRNTTPAERARLTRAQKRFDNMPFGVGNRVLFAALTYSGERFQILSAEATLPLASASYSFPTKE